jgi:recombination associated protein RdgC
LLLDDATVPSEFTHGDSVVLKSSSRSVARFKDMDLTDEDVVNRVVAGMHPVELAAQYKDNVLFAVTDQLIIKRLKFSDVMLKQATEDSAGEGVVAHFDATIALVTGELVELIGDLIKEIPAEEEFSTEELDDDEDEL